MRLAPRRASLLALTAALALGGCVGDGDDVVTTVDLPRQGGNLFTRYVALGNSITAGFQSGGIVAGTQQQSYVALLAQRAGVTNFGLPLFNAPGCPAPFSTPLGVGSPPPPVPCAGRSTDPAAQRPTQNLAVPGAKIADLFEVPVNSSIGSLYTFITGGRSQVDAMLDYRPTFVSVWIGNNDALDAATRGRLGPLAGADSLLTPLPVFQEYVRRLADSVRVATPISAMFVGVVDPVTAAPILQPGAYFWLARDVATNTFFGKPVNATCSPLNNLGQPNPLAANLVSFRILSDATVPEINCDPSAQGGAYLLDQAEITVLRNRIAAYNTALRTAATANGWIFVNPNTILQPLLNDTTVRTPSTPTAITGLYNNVRKCQLLATATTPAQIQNAILKSCPVIASGATDPRAPFVAPNVFGRLISFDAVHPSSAAHTFLAGTFADSLNRRFGTTLSNVKQ
ncbi:MAG TPA: SGNH/GDSL hydrolase family protein [Longimicrobium sp.]|nr:SGNH/GDSL hydrolase family protein [Longimicrobium sp.]